MTRRQRPVARLRCLVRGGCRWYVAGHRSREMRYVLACADCKREIVEGQR